MDLLERLDEIAARLQADPDALGLLALGSVGLDTYRLDEFSDLDFFVITNDKPRLLEDTSWLGQPIEWLHRNTSDGYRALVDAVFCEFAVFTPEELSAIPFAAGRVVWARPGFDTGALAPRPHPRPEDGWLVDEILSNLEIGILRWLRGEKLAAVRAVQGEALDNLLRLLGVDDKFAPARRAERDHELPWETMAGGYAMTVQSARCIFELLPHQFGGAMRERVGRLLGRAELWSPASPGGLGPAQ